MSNVKIELNSSGVAELLKSPEMQSILKDEVEKRAQMAGQGYGSDVHVHTRRAVGYIFATDDHSVHDNYENNTLLKVLG